MIGFVTLVCFVVILSDPASVTVPSLWKYTKLIQVHFWLSIVALGLLVSYLTIAGVLQGFGRLVDPKVPLSAGAVIHLSKPFLLGYEWLGFVHWTFRAAGPRGVFLTASL